MKKYLVSILVLLSLLALVISGCSNSTDTSTSTAAAAAAAATTQAASTSNSNDKSGGVLTYGLTKLDSVFGVPWEIKGNDRLSTGNSLEWLIVRNNEGGYDGRLATSWELADDHSSYTFKLRQGVKFHDGTAFNAESVKWNYEQSMAAGLPQFANFKSVEVVDEYTVRVNISAWNSEFLHNFASDTDGALIISREAYEKNGHDWCLTHPVGTGPFVYKEYKANESYVVTRNPDYWEQPYPYLDEMHFVVVPDSVTLMAALKSGEIDAAAIDLSNAATIEKDSRFVVRKEGMNLLGLVLTFNAKNTDSVWYDLKMREALEYALNKESITTNLLYGFAMPLYEIIRGVGSTGDSGTVARKYDPEKARQLIKETGNEGLQVELRYSSATTGPMADALLAVQENLNDVGLVCKLTPIDFAAFNLESFQPNEGNSIRCEVIRGDTVFPFTRVIENLSETTIYLPGAVRPAGFTELQTQAMAADDPAEVSRLTHEMEKLAYDSAMYCPLWTYPLLTVWNVKVKDMGGFYGGIPYQDCVYGWIEE